jgi:hypothetical protein
MNNLRVEFTIADFDCSVDDITNTIGITPTGGGLRGELRAVKSMKHLVNQSATYTVRSNYWCIAIDSPDKIHLDETLKIAKQLLEARLPELEKLPKKSIENAKKTINMYVNIDKLDSRMALNVSSELLIFLSTFNIELDLDVY